MGIPKRLPARSHPVHSCSSYFHSFTLTRTIHSLTDSLPLTRALIALHIVIPSTTHAYFYLYHATLTTHTDPLMRDGRVRMWVNATFRLLDNLLPLLEWMSAWMSECMHGWVNDKVSACISDIYSVKNDCLTRVMRFGNDCNEWRSQEWKSLPYRLTLLHTSLCPEQTKLLQSFNHLLSRSCRQGLSAFWLSIMMKSPQLICDVTRTRGISVVTSCSSIVFAHARWCKGNLH